MKKIYITGVSGTGKTTIATELEKRGFYVISIDETEELCSWVNKETGQNDGGKEVDMSVEFVDQHDWICDIPYLNRLLARDFDVAFVLGMATNQNEYLDLFDIIFVLECDPEIFLKRIENRADNNFGKDKNVQRQILERSMTYSKEMTARGAMLVNTNRPLDAVVQDIIRQATS